jgi:hypothetical protein
VTQDGRWLATGIGTASLRIWDLETGEGVAECGLPATMTCLVLVADTVVVGLNSGQVLFCRLRNFPIGPAVVTAFGSGDATSAAASCPHCGASVPAPESVRSYVDGGVPAVLALPETAWLEDRLVRDCPGRGKRLRFNPYLAQEPKVEQPVGRVTEPSKTAAVRVGFLSRLFGRR